MLNKLHDAGAQFLRDVVGCPGTGARHGTARSPWQCCQDSHFFKCLSLGFGFSVIQYNVIQIIKISSLL